MENKYFTPSIEDIRVGYECEISDTGIEPKWTKYIVSNSAINREEPIIIPSRVVDFIENYSPNRVRVPFLTKEQIEAEGWVEIEVSCAGECPRNYKKGEYKIIKWDNATELGIYKGSDCYFYGECKDINTFRYICKLLGI